MKKIIFFAALLFSAFSYGQLKKVELTPDEIDFIANNKANILGESLDNKDFDWIMSLNNTIFVFEILYKDKPLYTGTINKWYYKYDLMGDAQRKKISFCFRYSDLDNDIITELLESKTWDAEKTDTSKYICKANHELFTLSKNKKYILNDVVKDKIKVKLYKIVEQ
jgi:hypothetical protein